MILMVIESGARAFTSFCTRSGMFLYIVVPPLITMFPYRSFRMSTSHFIMPEGQFVDALALEAHELRLEQRFGRTEAPH